jgi:hypothetical protein
MKKVLSIIVLFLGISLITFAQKDYVMFETLYIKVKPDMKKDFEKGLAAHNKEYHASGPFTAHIWSVHTGSHEGEYLWAMGPLTFTDLDNRPTGEDHDEDWDKNIAPYVEKYSELTYWKLDKELSYAPEDGPKGKAIWSIFKLKPFEEYRFNELLSKVVEVYREKKYEYSFSVYQNQFDSKKGGDVVIEAMFGKWAFFDRDRTFKKDYEEVHGEGSWWKAMEEYKDVVICVEDELASFRSDLSGGGE